MTSLHECVNLGDKNGSIEVDLFSGNEYIYIKLDDTSSPGNHSGCVTVSSAQARLIAKHLLAAADVIDEPSAASR